MSIHGRRDAKKLRGRDGWRIRVGDYRVIHEIEEGRLLVPAVRIGHRKDRVAGFFDIAIQGEDAGTRAMRGQAYKACAGPPASEGLKYFSARWYDAQTGRFISEDPVLDGTLWYAYVAKNPMSLVDPTGLEYEYEGGGYGSDEDQDDEPTPATPFIAGQ